MTSRLATIAAAAAVLCLVLPSAAGARIWLHADNGPRLSINAQLPQEDDEVTVSAQGQGTGAVYVFEDPAGVSQATAPCVQLTPTSGTCPADREALFVNLGKGTNDLDLDLGAATGPGFGLKRFSFNGSTGRDFVDLRGGSLPATVGQVRVDGGGGADRLLGSPRRDRLNGDRGRDVLRGGAGFDLFAGGPGFDRVVGPVTAAEVARATSIERF